MELTQKGEVVSRLQAKAGQIGKILNNLEKYNHLIKDDKKSFDRRGNDRRLVSKTQNVEKKEQTKCDKNESRDIEATKAPSTSDSTDSFVNIEMDLKLDDVADPESKN